MRWWWRRSSGRRAGKPGTGVRPESGTEAGAGAAEPTGPHPGHGAGFRPLGGPDGRPDDDHDPGPGRRPGSRSGPPPAATSGAGSLGWRALDDGALPRLLGALAADPVVGELLDLCADRGALTRREWSDRVQALMAAAPRAEDAVIRLALAEEIRPGTQHLRAEAVRALMFATADPVPLLTRVADQHGRPRSGKPHETVARAAVRTLGAIGGEAVLPPLRRLKNEAPLPAVRKAAATELDRVLSALGNTRDTVPEWRAAAFELNADGARRLPLGAAFEAELRVEPGGRVSIGYLLADGTPFPDRPATPQARRALTTLDRLADEVRAAVRADLERLADLLRGRELEPRIWRANYVGHPLTGRVAAGLVWELSTDGGASWTAGLAEAGPDGSWRLRTVRDRPVPVPDGARLRLMRPVRATSQSGRAWQARLRRLGITPGVTQFD